MKSIRQKLYALLRRSETYTKTDMVYLAKGGTWLSVAQGIATVSSLLLAIAMANLVPPHVFGNYKFILSLAGILGAFTLTGIGSAITQAVARGFDRTLQFGVKTHLLWGIGTTLIAFGIALYYALNANMILAISMVLAGISIPLMSAFALFSSYLAGKKDFKTHTLYNLWRNIIPVAALILTIFITEHILIIVLVYFASHTIVTIVFHILTVQKYNVHGPVDHNAIRLGKHLSAMGIIGKTAAYLDQVLVFHFLGAAQLAVYAFAMTPINQLKSPNIILSKLALPKFSEKSMDDLRHTLPKKVLLLTGIMCIPVIAYIVAAPYIFNLLFPQYMESIIYSQVFAFILILTPSLLFNEALIAHSHTKALYIVQTLAPIVKIIALLILLPLFGIWGAIISIICFEALRSLLRGYFFFTNWK